VFRAECHRECLESVRNLRDQYGNVDVRNDPTAGDCFLAHVNVLESEIDKTMPLCRYCAQHTRRFGSQPRCSIG
jgi:hypothetical protein